jgi:hypothetical protein
MRISEGGRDKTGHDKTMKAFSCVIKLIKRIAEKGKKEKARFP